MILGNRVHDVFSVKIRSGALTVGATATLITSDAAGVLEERKMFSIYNNSSVTVWLGDASVTTTSGTPLLSGEFMVVAASADCDWYAIVATGTANTRIIEGY